MTHFRSSESYQSAVTLGKTVARDCDTAKKYCDWLLWTLTAFEIVALKTVIRSATTRITVFKATLVLKMGI